MIAFQTQLQYLFFCFFFLFLSLFLFLFLFLSHFALSVSLLLFCDTTPSPSITNLQFHISSPNSTSSHQSYWNHIHILLLLSCLLLHPLFLSPFPSLCLCLFPSLFLSLSSLSSFLSSLHSEYKIALFLKKRRKNKVWDQASSAASPSLHSQTLFSASKEPVEKKKN